MDYTQIQIITHETTTRQYCIDKGSELTTKELIKLAIIDDNYDYADYLIYRHLKIHENMIDEKLKKIGYTFNAILATQNMDEDEFMDKFEEDYEIDIIQKLKREYKKEFKVNKVPKTKLIDAIILSTPPQNYNIFTYLYLIEKKKLESFYGEMDDVLHHLRLAMKDIRDAELRLNTVIS